MPRFDSGACFAAILGNPDNGRWLLAPAGEVKSREHRYVEDTLVLETTFETPDGRIRVLDAMPLPRNHSDDAASVVRVVQGLQGRVEVRSELIVRYDYGHIVPWVQHQEGRLLLAAGPDAVVVDSDAPHEADDQGRLSARFAVSEGQRVELSITWFPVGAPVPAAPNPRAEVDRARAYWQEWAGRGRYDGPYREAVVRSLLLLKGLSYGPSGGIVAAATTSLPEALGGVRNWDYRFCWLRDATYTLLALLHGGYQDEAVAWREWLLRALAGRPEQMQIMYGVDGRRRLTEVELDWLPGYEKSSPVRVGNAAHAQFQLDVYGELMDALHQSREHGIPPNEHALDVQQVLMNFLESHWDEPDDGIWEVRGPRRDFVHSKVMAWAAVDRAVKDAERHGLQGPLEKWKQLRGRIHDEVCAKGWDAERQTFTQFYGSRGLDAALLLIAPVGFLPADDDRVRGTVRAIERELLHDGFVNRYNAQADAGGDGLPGHEATFLPCTLWLADVYLLQGRTDEARQVLERVLSIRGRAGLLTEEYDVSARRLVGNLPQAFSHVPLVNTAITLGNPDGPVTRRGRHSRHDSDSQSDSGSGGDDKG
jgi:GH15 family glucan-1,4-alpha-glucosidase